MVAEKIVMRISKVNGQFQGKIYVADKLTWASNQERTITAVIESARIAGKVYDVYRVDRY